MRLKVNYQKHILRFKFEAGTSRGTLSQKETYFIKVMDEHGSFGLGESGPLKGLSVDDCPDFELQLNSICEKLHREPSPPTTLEEIGEWVRSEIPEELPAIRFGVETALRDWFHGGKRIVYPSGIIETGAKIPINGLVWMGNIDFMLRQIDEKLNSGFDCIKIKIGALDFKRECEVLQYIRDRYSPEQISVRVDANGAFSPEEAKEKLRTLGSYGLHSIEQPLQPGQGSAMRELCDGTPLPIALDEELIGINGRDARSKLLDDIQPQYIILKPTLLGGLAETLGWIQLAEARKIGWWITSALESNIGLNAIAQFTSALNPVLHQGLGTGQLYTNNIPSPLEITDGYLRYNSMKNWGLPVFKDGSLH